MRKFLRVLLILTAGLLLFPNLTAQDPGEASQKVKKKNSIGVGAGMVYIPKGMTSKGDGATGVGLELVYDRALGGKWYFLAAAEWELKEYAIKYEGQKVKRKNILILSAGMGYKVLPKLKIALGPAYEIAEDNQYFTANIMAKYEVFSAGSIKGNLGTYLAWRIDRYYSVGLNFSVSKAF